MPLFTKVCRTSVLISRLYTSPSPEVSPLPLRLIHLCKRSFGMFAGAYLLTQKDVFLDRSHISQLLAYILAGKDINLRIDLPPPVILKVAE